MTYSERRDGSARAVFELMSFGIYLTGIVMMIAGLIYGATLLHVPAHWIVVSALVMLGLGTLAAVRSTRQRDPQ